jgi:hypothetical protein
MKRFAVILTFISTLSAAQQTVQPKLSYQFELGSYFSLTNKLPFWQTSNQYGNIPDALPALLLRQSIHSKNDTNRHFCKLSYGFEGVTILGQKPQLLLPESYLDLKIGKIHFWAGRKKEKIGLVDSTLSSGSISWSGNALPIPKIQIEIPRYTKLFFDWLAFKGSYSHGWFGNQSFVQNYYLHQKTFFFRLGKPQSSIKLEGGIVHNVQWGGTPKYNLPIGSDRLFNGKFPEDWFVYGNVVLPFKKLWKESEKYANYNTFETDNRFGNHLGSIDLAGEINFKKGILYLYRQFYFEDGQIFSLTNTDDGLYGISYRPKNRSSFKKIVAEFLFTKNQGHYRSAIARLFDIKDRHYGAQSFYFNHAQYYDGWSYNRQTIGTPFLTPQENLRWENQFHENGGVFVNNNRVVAFYVGLENQIGKIKLTNKASYSKNFGAYEIYFTPVTQISYSVNTLIPLPKIKSLLNVNIGVDHGDLIKDNFGSYVSIMRAW